MDHFFLVVGPVVLAMRWLLIIFLVSLVSIDSFSQTRRNILYSCFLKFPESRYDVSFGLDHAMQISRKKWTSGRLYFVVSPNVLWSGYNFNSLSGQPYLKSKFQQYELVLPLHLRYELAPFRVLLGKSSGRHDNDFAVFFDVGISVNYVLGASLREEFNYSDKNSSFQYLFDGPITSSVENRITANYLTFNMGFRFNRIVMFLRAYQPFAETRYKNLSADWGKPAGAKSFFYDQFLTNPFYKQGTVTLCFGYSF
jgi:hypothetical protein